MIKVATVLLSVMLMSCKAEPIETFSADAPELTVTAEVVSINTTCVAYSVALRAMPYTCQTEAKVPPEAIDVDCDVRLNGCGSSSNACNFYVMRKVRVSEFKSQTVDGKNEQCPNDDADGDSEVRREIIYSVRFRSPKESQPREFVTKTLIDVSNLEPAQTWKINIATNKPVESVSAAN